MWWPLLCIPAPKSCWPHCITAVFLWAHYLLLPTAPTVPPSQAKPKQHVDSPEDQIQKSIVSEESRSSLAHRKVGKIKLGAVEIAQWIKALVKQAKQPPSWAQRPEFNSWDPQKGGRRDLTPQSSWLTSTCMPRHFHACVYTIIIINNNHQILKSFLTSYLGSHKPGTICIAIKNKLITLEMEQSDRVLTLQKDCVLYSQPCWK